METFHSYVMLILAAVFVTCSGPIKGTSNSRPAPQSNKIILTGKLSAEQLLKQLPEYQSECDMYQPDEAVILQLRKFPHAATIVVFLGTWCPDCQRQVPRFLKIMEQTGNSNLGYSLIGLDRTKRDLEGLAEKNQIEFVPTFIVFQGDKELGRIVENPMVSIEQDLLDILLTIGN